MPTSLIHPPHPVGLTRQESETLRTLGLGLWEGWRVFPRVHLPGVGNHRSDSDLDFVLLHPRHGLHIIEAKDSEVRNLSQAPVATYETATGIKTKDIVRQLKGQRRVLSEFLGVDPASIGSYLWAPHGEESLQGNLGEIRNAELGAGYWFVRGETIALIFKHLEKCERVLSNYDSVLNSLMKLAVAAETESSLKPFEPGEAGLSEQKRFLRARTKHRAITGVAGTGKTQVLLREAREAGSGLFLCYNDLLREFLSEQLADSIDAGRVRVLNMDDLARELMGSDYVSPVSDAGRDYESQFITLAARIREAPAAWVRAIKHLWIDEAQDLSGAHLMSIVALQAVSGAYVTVAHDETQQWRLQGMDLAEFRAAPWEGRSPWEEPFVLKNNLRNGDEIRRLAREELGFLIGAEAAEEKMLLDSHREGRNRAPTPRVISKGEILKELGRVMGSAEAKANTLVLTSDSNDWLKGVASSRTGIFPVSEARPLLAESKGVRVETVLRSKGLEAKVVVAFLRDEREGADHLRKACAQKAYLAATRATNAFYLFWVR